MKFQNIIASDKYQSLKAKEQYEFLLTNEIYIRPKEMTDEYENDLFNKQSRFRSSKNKWWLEAYYSVNPIIIDNVISLFLKDSIDVSTIEEKILTDVGNSLNTEETLKKHHKIYNDIITDSNINLHHFYEGRNINYKKLKKYITNHFKQEDCRCINISVLENYITTSELDLYLISIYENLINVIGSMKIIDLILRLSNFENKIIEDIDIEELNTVGTRIILMFELGIIDMLIKKYDLKIDNIVNDNLLANIIHSFTGINKTTIQPILNSIFNPSNSQRNNPYNKKNIDKVKAKLIELGLN